MRSLFRIGKDGESFRKTNARFFVKPYPKRSVIIMPGTVIKSGAVVEYAIVGSDSVIESRARVGSSPEMIENRDDWGIAVVGHNVTVSAEKVVAPKQIIGENI